MRLRTGVPKTESEAKGCVGFAPALHRHRVNGKVVGHCFCSTTNRRLPSTFWQTILESASFFFFASWFYQLGGCAGCGWNPLEFEIIYTTSLTRLTTMHRGQTGVVGRRVACHRIIPRCESWPTRMPTSQRGEVEVHRQWIVCDMEVGNRIMCEETVGLWNLNECLSSSPSSVANLPFPMYDFSCIVLFGISVPK